MARGRRRRPRRWRKLVAALALLGLLAGVGVNAVEPRVRHEWAVCLRTGDPPRTIDAQEMARPRAAAQVEPVLWETAGSSVGERTVTVAVIDGGVDASHPELAPHTVRGLDLVNPCGDGLTDPGGHGTGVAGVIIETTDRLASVAGRPRIEIMPIRTSTPNGSQLRMANAAAISWAVANGADVINLSATSDESRDSMPEEAAVRYAAKKGVPVVAAAGNRPDAPVRYPAGYESVLSVTSVDGNGAVSGFAATDPFVDVAARGGSVWTTAASGGSLQASGTSFAAPVVTGTVAMMKAVKPGLTRDQLRSALLRAAEPAPVTGRAGGHRDPIPTVDPERTLRLLQGATLRTIGA